MVIVGRILLLGYVLAGIAASALWLAGMPPFVAILWFWIGGACLVVGIAAIAAAILPPRDVDEAAETRLIEEALRQWEEDRLADRTRDGREEPRSKSG